VVWEKRDPLLLGTRSSDDFAGTTQGGSVGQRWEQDALGGRLIGGLLIIVGHAGRVARWRNPALAMLPWLPSPLHERQRGERASGSRVVLGGQTLQRVCDPQCVSLHRAMAARCRTVTGGVAR
jgi:hypothetical protein